MKLLENFEAIDLTHPLDSSVPTWRGRCGFHFEVKMDYDRGVRVLFYKCHAGVGTHMDAPAHFYPDGAVMSDIPLSQLIVPARIIDVSAQSHPDFFVGPEEILEHEKKWGKIEEGSLVFAYTGWEKFWGDVARYRNEDLLGKMHFPGFHVKAAELLLERKIVGLGIDTLSPDGSNNGPGGKFPVHECVLREGKYIIENAAHLSKMPAKGGYVLALPLKITVGAEAPMRLVGLIPIINKQTG
jgi:kynurenine formamidase